MQPCVQTLEDWGRSCGYEKAEREALENIRVTFWEHRDRKHAAEVLRIALGYDGRKAAAIVRKWEKKPPD